MVQLLCRPECAALRMMATAADITRQSHHFVTDNSRHNFGRGPGRRSGLKKRDALGGSLLAIPLEDGLLVVEAEERAPCGAGKGMRQHLLAMAQHEPGAVQERWREVPQLHPPFRAPAEELDVVRRQMLRA